MELINNKKYWTIGLTLTITVLVFITVQLFQVLVLAYLSYLFPDISHEKLTYSNLGIISILSSITGSLILFAFIKLKEISIVEYLNLSLPPINVSVIFIFLSFFLMFIIGYLSNTYPEIFDSDFVLESYRQANNLPLFYLGVVFFGPVFEEFLFRGFLFKGLEKSFLGGTGAVFVSAIIFVLVHLQYGISILLFIVFPLSIMLGYARLKSGSLLLPILIHMINNLATSVITHFEVY